MRNFLSDGASTAKSFNKGAVDTSPTPSRSDLLDSSELDSPIFLGLSLSTFWRTLPAVAMTGAVSKPMPNSSAVTAPSYAGLGRCAATCDNSYIKFKSYNSFYLCDFEHHVSICDKFEEYDGIFVSTSVIVLSTINSDTIITSQQRL
jgi:hypothetical protein